MVALALIRHGEYRQLTDTPSALQPYPLTDRGVDDVRKEARLFGRWLRDSGYRLNAEIHCSTLLRAWQTADLYREELAELYSGEPVLRSFPALCERSVGALANLTVGEIERIVKADPRLDPLPEGWKSASEFRLPFDGAESLLEAGQRVAAHLQTLPIGRSDNHIQLIVGHGASIRHASYHLNVITFDDVKRFSMFFARPVVFEKRDRTWVRLYGNWKDRRTAEPID